MNLSNSAVLSYGRIFGDGYQAHNQIGRWLAQTYGAPVIDNEESVRMMGGQSFDRLFFLNGASRFGSLRMELFRIASRHIEAGKPFYLCVNDYSVQPAGQLMKYRREPNFHILGTIKEGRGWRAACQYLNWNALTIYEDLPKDDHPRKIDLVYYGAHRPGREGYFKTYFDTPAYKVFVDCGKNSQDQFKKYRAVELIDCKNLPRLLISSKFTLYMEDEATHQEYASLANRFYECASAGVVQLFDKNCSRTLDLAGIPKPVYAPYLVSGPMEVYLRMIELGDSLAAHRLEQSKWIKRYGLGFDALTFAETIGSIEGFAFSKK